ncbi:MAG: DUF1697 domain-containing protein [Devosia sp.]
MMRYAAFLRGVNLGKRTVKSAELKAAFEAMGFGEVKTLLASGNVLFDAKASKTLKAKIETGLKEQFGFEILVVLRSIDELKAMVASNPYRREEGDDAKLHVILFDEPVLTGLKLKTIAGDFDYARIDPREAFLIAYKKPDGTYLGGSALAIEKEVPRKTLMTARNWNTILKAIA